MFAKISILTLIFHDLWIKFVCFWVKDFIPIHLLSYLFLAVDYFSFFIVSSSNLEAYTSGHFCLSVYMK